MTRGITSGGRKTKKIAPAFAVFIILAFAIASFIGLVTAITPTELEVINLTGQKATLNYNQILAMPNITEYAELYCYGNLVTSGEWTGVKVSDLLKAVNADLTAASIDFSAKDGYKISIPMDYALQPNVILAYTIDGSPLAENFRLVLPGINGNMWISQVSSLTLSSASADSIASTANGPVINVNQNLFTHNTGQASQSTQPTPTPTAKVNTPIPTPSFTQTPEPTSLPSATADSSGTLINAQNGFQIDFYLVIGAAIFFTLISVGIYAKRKNIKSDL